MSTLSLHKKLTLAYTLQQLPIWWRWYYWASPVAWTLYGLVASQVGDIDTLLEIPGAGSVPIKEYLKTSLGFEHDFLPAVVAAHIDRKSVV